MGDMRFKVGDRVRIKSLDWYNENKDEDGNIRYKRDGSAYPVFFSKYMSNFCGEILTIKSVFNHSYHMNETSSCEFWTDEMIEGLVEEEAKSHNNMCKKLIDEMNPNVEVNVKTPKFKIGDRVITDTNMKGKIIDVVEEGWYRVDFDDYNGISQPNGVVPEESMSLVEEEIKPKFNVGDRVIARDMSGIWEITNVKDDILYTIKRENHTFTLTTYGSFLTLYEGVSDKKEEMKSEDSLLDEYEELTDRAFKGGYEKCKSDIELNGFQLPEDYIFKDENGNEILTNKVILEKKKKEYPNTYEECCKVLGVSEFEYNHTGTKVWYRHKLMATLDKLLLCRDAYWKLAGDEFGLGKPWEPTDSDYITGRYCIFIHRGNIICDTPAQDCILTFPTEEMRDAFYENFKELIEFVRSFCNMAIIVRDIQDKEMTIYNPDGSILVVTHNILCVNDILIQIREQKLSGYTFQLEGRDYKQEITDYGHIKQDFPHVYADQLRTLMGF